MHGRRIAVHGRRAWIENVLCEKIQGEHIRETE
jgi:hypothetical protein